MADDVNTEQQSQNVDVHLLDVLAQIERLLRTARHIQREALRVRDVAGSTTAERLVAADRIRECVATMMRECRELGPVVEELAELADELRASIKHAGSPPKSDRSRVKPRRTV